MTPEERGQSTHLVYQYLPSGLDGSVLPARLAATAAVFAAGRAGLRHVEVIARVLASRPAGRLSPEVWAGAEAQLAGKADVYTPHELHERAPHWSSCWIRTVSSPTTGPRPGSTSCSCPGSRTAAGS